MTISKSYTKNNPVYKLVGDDGGWIASFNSLVMAAVALRYMSGLEMSDREKTLALAALESTGRED